MIEDKTLLDMVLTLGPADQADVRLQLRDVLDSVINGRADSESAVGDEINGPRGEPIAAWDRDGLLDKLHLLDRTGGLVVEVHRLRGKVFLTDGAWERDKLRTFPFADESQCLLDYAEAQGYPEWADFLIDPACGCGHHAIAFPILLPVPVLTSTTGQSSSPQSISCSTVATTWSSRTTTLPTVFR